MNELLIPVSPGELLDRISILEIRASKLTDPLKIAKVRAEILRLRIVWEESSIVASHLGQEVVKLWMELWEIGKIGWMLEDRVRELESLGDYGVQYITSCRAIHHNNDNRSGLKRAINDLVGSEHFEEKVHGGVK